MTDEDMTKLCAEVMGISLCCCDPSGVAPPHFKEKPDDDSWADYWPLYDDAQAMALVKRFQINICWFEVNVPSPFKPTVYMGDRDDLNRAIVECVVQIQLERTQTEKSWKEA